MLRRKAAASSPSLRYMYAFVAWTRGAVRLRTQRMSAGVMKCHVGRNRCVRRIAPDAKACSTSASVVPGARIASAHLAPA